MRTVVLVLTLGSCGWFSLIARAESPAKPLGILDVFNLQLATDPQISPDGNRIGAFADERRSGWGMFGGSGENLLQRDLREVAEDVGEMVATGDYSLHR